MFGYATDLRSSTQGRATYTMQFERYEEVPANIAEEIVEHRSRRARGRRVVATLAPASICYISQVRPQAAQRACRAHPANLTAKLQTEPDFER